MEQLIQPYLLAKDEGSAYWFFGSLLVIKDTAVPSSGSLTWIEQLVPPGDGSPYHIHHGEDEIFYVLEGEMSFVSGDNVWKGGPGTFVFLPRGIPHGFKTEGDKPSRSLLITTCGSFEEFVREMGVPAAELVIPMQCPPNIDNVVAIAAKYQIEILGPLPEYSV